METEKTTSKAAQVKPTRDVMEIVWNVRRGARKKADLRRCGCENCRAALRVLEGS